MLTKLFLSGIAFLGGILFFASADDPAQQKATSKSRPQNAVPLKSAIPEPGQAR